MKTKAQLDQEIADKRAGKLNEGHLPVLEAMLKVYPKVHTLKTLYDNTPAFFDMDVIVRCLNELETLGILRRWKTAIVEGVPMQARDDNPMIVFTTIGYLAAKKVF